MSIFSLHKLKTQLCTYSHVRPKYPINCKWRFDYYSVTINQLFLLHWKLYCWSKVMLLSSFNLWQTNITPIVNYGIKPHIVIRPKRYSTCYFNPLERGYRYPISFSHCHFYHTTHFLSRKFRSWWGRQKDSLSNFWSGGDMMWGRPNQVVLKNCCERLDNIRRDISAEALTHEFMSDVICSRGLIEIVSRMHMECMENRPQSIL